MLKLNEDDSARPPAAVDEVLPGYHMRFGMGDLAGAVFLGNLHALVLMAMTGSSDWTSTAICMLFGSGSAACTAYVAYRLTSPIREYRFWPRLCLMFFLDLFIWPVTTMVFFLFMIFLIRFLKSVHLYG